VSAWLKRVGNWSVIASRHDSDRPAPTDLLRQDLPSMFIGSCLRPKALVMLPNPAGHRRHAKITATAFGLNLA